MMTPENRPRFFQALTQMAELFQDVMNPERQKLYWMLFTEEHPHVTIEAWEYACRQAMQRETFYKVPLPAHLMEYVREYRKSSWELRQQTEMPDGSHKKEQLLALREPLDLVEHVRQLIKSVWPDMDADTPLASPTDDPEARRT